MPSHPDVRGRGRRSPLPSLQSLSESVPPALVPSPPPPSSLPPPPLPPPPPSIFSSFAGWPRLDPGSRSGRVDSDTSPPAGEQDPDLRVTCQPARRAASESRRGLWALAATGRTCRCRPPESLRPSRSVVVTVPEEDAADSEASCAAAAAAAAMAAARMSASLSPRRDARLAAEAAPRAAAAERNSGIGPGQGMAEIRGGGGGVAASDERRLRDLSQAQSGDGGGSGEVDAYGLRTGRPLEYVASAERVAKDDEEVGRDPRLATTRTRFGGPGKEAKERSPARGVDSKPEIRPPLLRRLASPSLRPITCEGRSGHFSRTTKQT
jgi:hypothetical protein